MKFIDLFCGLGGFRLALENLGHQCVFSSEINPHAREIYKENFGEYPDGDICKIDAQNIPDFDILCAGFPCQPFSSAGKRMGFDDIRGTLFFEVARIIKEKQPQYFILENVKGLLTHDNGNTFKVILAILQDLNYNISYKVFNACNFGVAQARERIIIVGSKSYILDLNKIEKKSKTCLSNMLSTSCDNIIDKSKYTLIDKKYIKTQKSGLIFVGYMNKNIRKKGILPNTMHLSRVHRQCNRIYSINGLCPTITSGEQSGRYYIYDDRKDIVRKLTVDECFALMGFPDDYKKIGSNSKLYERIGNSVCVPMIQEIAQYILNERKEQNEIKSI